MNSDELMLSQSAARGAAWLAKQVERSMSEIELTTPQYRLLAFLEGGGASATNAAERLAVSPPSITAIVDGLVTRSMVCRRTVEGDRRRVELLITENGSATLAKADQLVAERLAEVARHGDDSFSTEDALRALTWWFQAIRGEFASRQQASE